VTLVIPRQSPVPADPGECPLHDPALGQHDKAVPVTAAHDLECPCAGASYGGFHLAALVPPITDDALDEGEGPPCLPQQRLGSVSILHARWMNSDRQEQAERVSQDVALAASGLFARVIA